MYSSEPALAGRVVPSHDLHVVPILRHPRISTYPVGEKTKKTPMALAQIGKLRRASNRNLPDLLGLWR
jgi:hypothetical protein